MNPLSKKKLFFLPMNKVIINTTVSYQFQLIQVQRYCSTRGLLYTMGNT